MDENENAFISFKKLRLSARQTIKVSIRKKI